MSKLLAWGGALFLVRYELGELQIQRVGINIEEKKVSLRFCSISNNDKVDALPVDARLIAANEVEDAELATRYPVLIFLSSQVAVQSLSATRKRQRSIERHKAVDSKDNTVPESSSGLLFYMLYQAVGDVNEIRCRFLNMLEIPIRSGDYEEEGLVGGISPNVLQTFLVDGPHVLLFEHRLQRATLLKLRHGDNTLEFVKYLEEVEVAHAMTDDGPEAFEVVSCTYVSEAHSTRPHLLIHAQQLRPSSSSNRHTWSVVDLHDARARCTSRQRASLCHYLPVFPPLVDWSMSTLEQITCCCFISELRGVDFVASSSSEMNALTSWDDESTTHSTLTSIGVTTLVITGTSSNTIYVHTNGILLASYVLPTQPAEMWSLCEESVDQRHVICVRCDDECRSFYVLSFSSKVQNVCIEPLLSFTHVGHAHIGSFAGIRTCDESTLAEILLLNDVEGIFDLKNSTHTIDNEVETYRLLDHKQMVKRSVLISQKASSSEVKLSCHRLRLHEEKETKHGSRLRKRLRNNEEADLNHSKAGPFRYIERTQKARAKSISHFEPASDSAADTSVASRAQLHKLACCLSARLSDGLQELERLQIIVSDKVSLAYQLNQLIVQLWLKLQARARSPSIEDTVSLPHLSVRETDSLCLGFQNRVDMETIVSASSSQATALQNCATYGPIKQVSEVALVGNKLEQQVSLEQFIVLEYVSSSSLVHAEVVLKTLSDLELNDSFVFLTAPKAGQTCTQGWRCSSSVALEFSSSPSMVDLTTKQGREARFHLDLQCTPSFSLLREQKPLEVMLWLHWKASEDDRISNTGLLSHPSESALAIAIVKICPQYLGSIDESLRTTAGKTWSNGKRISKDQNQLLFISSGSSLASWFRKQRCAIPSSIDSVVRPTFALMSINVRPLKRAAIEMSRLIAALPPDVYAMHNPFQHSHLRALQRLLRSMRQEILAIRCQELQDREKKTEKQPQKAEDRDPVSIFHAMQRDTDLQANQLLQRLQMRVNFHSMWFDAGTTTA